jgi:hypothetical protein
MPQGERPEAKAFAGMIYDALNGAGIEITIGAKPSG